MAAPETEDSKAFQQFILDDSVFKPGEWRTRSLGSSPLDVTYEIVFFRVAGVFRERDGTLDAITPLRGGVRGSVFAAYQFQLGSLYHIKIVTQLPMRFPGQLPGKGVAKLALDYDDKLIEPIGRTSLTISSFYDLEYWSSKLKGVQPSRTALTISCQHENRIDRGRFLRKELLCPEITLPVEVV